MGLALAVDGRQLWIGTTDGLLLRVDPSGEITAERKVADSIQLVAADPEGVWVVDQFAGTVLRIDPVSLRAVGDPVPFRGSIDAIEVLGEHVWVLDFGTGLLSRISILNGSVTQVSVPVKATSLAAGLGAIWVAHDGRHGHEGGSGHRRGIALRPGRGLRPGDRGRSGAEDHLGRRAGQIGPFRSARPRAGRPSLYRVGASTLEVTEVLIGAEVLGVAVEESTGTTWVYLGEAVAPAA